MKLRSITCFLDPGFPVVQSRLRSAGAFTQAARAAFEAAGYAVQSTRLATIPFPRLVPTASSGELIHLAQNLEETIKSLGFDYLSLGPALPDQPQSYAAIPEILENTQNIFMGGMMTLPNGSISQMAVEQCAKVIYQTARISGDGFTNLRFAALANVLPGTPFFPAAYAEGETMSFSLATEAADLAVKAFQKATTLNQARQRLVETIEKHAHRLEQVADKLSQEYGLTFQGIDFTLAPFPKEKLSIGHALECLGLPAVGLHGSLAAAAFLIEALEGASYCRVGFNGLMTPILEDSTLAKRAAQGILTVKDLLLYATVCGTGLDTVPLPGETTIEQLYAVLFDLAALAHRLKKPLTARLMPLPGKQAGESTEFDFAYFVNSRVLALEAQPLSSSLRGREDISPL